MNSNSHWRTPDFIDNRKFPVGDLDVCDVLMTRDIGPINYDNNSLCPEFVQARVGQSPEINPFQFFKTN